MATEKKKPATPGPDRMEEAIRYLAAQTGHDQAVDNILTQERKAEKAGEKAAGDA